jgi:hypothetical protein
VGESTGGAGEARIEQESSTEAAFMGGPGQSERRDESVESGEGETFQDERERGGIGGPDRGE